MSSKTLLLLLTALLVSSTTAPAREGQGYAQTYIILIKGNVSGTEKVNETGGDKGEIISTSEHEMLITDGLETKQMAFSTKMVLSKANLLVSYSYKYSGPSGDSYDVVIQNNQITRTLRRGDRTNEATTALQPDTVLVDFNVYHHYDFLARRYDVKKGGRQVFSNYVPVIGNEIPLALTYVGNDSLDFGKGPVPVRNFKVEFVGIWAGTMCIDKDGRLVRLAVPAQDLEVIRQDLVGSSTK
jgi:hypothetical protein